MKRNTLYHLSMGVAGLSLGLVGVKSVLTEGIAPGPGLMAFGGGGILLSSLFALSGKASSDFEPEEFVWIAVIAAILSFSGMILTFIQ